MKKTETSWGGAAAWYDELLSGDDTYQSQVILPNLLRLVTAEGKRVADIACGQGYFANAFAAAGAVEVFGADISPELIALARKNAASTLSAELAKKVRFEVAPADKIPVAKSGAYDVATIVLALQNIKDLTGTVREAARILTRGGRLVLVLNHPCFRIPKASAWGYDEAKQLQFRRVDHYGLPFTAEIDMNPGTSSGVGPAKKVKTLSLHRPLQDYFKALSAAGLITVGLEEWISHKKSESGPRAKAEDQARKEFPLFLTIVAQKN